MLQKGIVFILILATFKTVLTTPVPSDEIQTDVTLTENVEMSTEKIDASSAESRENVDVDFEATQKSDISTESRYSIRDFYRRRRQKNVETTLVDARPRVAKNQTASEILMQKIRASKEQQKSYFDPAAPGIDNSLSQKRKRLVRARPKFNELSAAATSSSIVTVPPPSSVSTTASLTSSATPPLIAATNTLLMLHESKSLEHPSQGSQPFDWSRKKAGGGNTLISSRLKNFRERKKNANEEKAEILPTTPGNIFGHFCYRNLPSF